MPCANTFLCLSLRFYQIPLGLNPQANCFVLQLKNVSILLDCGAELSSLLDFVPKGLKNPNPHISASHATLLDGIELPTLDDFDIGTLDCILITNFYNMACLPYITEYYGFKGKIYATEPTVQLGKQHLIELSRQLSNDQVATDSQKQTSSNLTTEQLSHLHLYRKIYTEAEVASTFNKITICAFDEQVRLLGGLTASPHSAGYCLGSCNWVIRTEHEKVAFLAQTFSGNSSVRFSSQPLHSAPLSNADVMVMTQLALPTVTDLDAHFGDLCSQIGQTLANGGNVLLPITNVGLLLDLFAILDSYMVNTGLNASTHYGLTSAPAIAMYYISSISESVLAYANISAEWVDSIRLERVYQPNNPYTHSDLIESSRLHRLESVEQFLQMISPNTFAPNGASTFGNVTATNQGRAASPCIVFCGHPSLRMGETVALVEKFKTNSRNTVLFTEPAWNAKRCFEPFEPSSCRLHVCPIDTRLTVKAACDLVRRYQPRRVLVPKNAKSFIAALEDCADVIPLSNGDELKISLKRKFERGFISPELAAQIDMASQSSSKTASNASYSSIRATVLHRDGVFSLVPSSSSSPSLINNDSDSTYQPSTEGKEAAIKMEVDGQPSLAQSSPSSSSTPATSSSSRAGSERPRRTYGSPVPIEILNELEEMSINVVEVESNEDPIQGETITIRLPQLEASLVMRKGKTTIQTKKEESRKLLKQLILKHLQ